MQHLLRAVLCLALLVPGSLLHAQLLPLKVSENQRFLVKNNGEPFFYLGDTAWELFHRLRREEIDLYLRDRAGKGFNVIQCVILAERNGLTEPNAEGHLPLINNDLTQPNEAYFELVDYAIDKAEEYGLYMALLPTWGSHVINDPSPFTPETAYAYGLFLGQRWKGKPHLFWVLGGDRGPEGFEEVWDRMALGLHKGDGGRLMTYHIYGGRSSAEVFHDAPWLDFNMIQSGHMHPAAPNYEAIAEDYARTPTKPVLDGEPNYEGLPIGFSEIGEHFGPFDVRRASYWSVFAGGCGITYGHNCIWQMHDPNREGVIWAETPWYEAIHAPGSSQMRHIKHLMRSRPYLSRIPDQGILLDGGASWPAEGTPSNHIVATRDGSPGEQDASYFMIYYPSPYKVKVNTSFISGDRLNAWWYSPRSGMAYPLGTTENTGTFELPWEKRLRKGMGGPDWVLVIDDASKGYGPPGQP